MKRKKRNNGTKTVIRFPSGKTEQTKAVKISAPKSNKRFLLWIMLSAVFIALLSSGIFIFYLSKDLPSLTKLERIEPEMATQVYSVDGKVIHSFFTFNRTYTSFEQIPKSVTDALLATEDRDFYSHWGINIFRVAKAVIKNILAFDIKGEGASTITMQLSRNLYFGFAKTWDRKIKEAITALQIERTYAKQEIISMYLNIVPFGNNAFGIKAASRRYFNKEAEDLDVSEAAMLVGILKGQSYYSPIRYPERALSRRNVVLYSMMLNDNLTKAAFDSLKQLPLNMNLHDPYEMTVAPYFTEYIRQQMNILQDSLGVNVYEDGLRVFTTLDTRIQKHMDSAVVRHVGPIQARVRRQPAFKKLKETLSDSAFNELTTLQIAFTAIDPKNGHIRAMIGGRDFKKYKYNHVTLSRRQPGSAFKPFLYTAAIDNGFTPAMQYRDQPTFEMGPDSTRWTPENYNKSWSGEMVTLREGIRHSLNTIAIQLIADITPKVVIQYAKDMGIKSTRLRPYSSLALGSSEVIPLELVSAYGTFANNGVHVKPVSIIKIEDKNGNVIYTAYPEKREVLSSGTTYIMNSMLQDVMNRGTGYSVRSKYKFYHQAGGKTGTTNDYSDAWFVGFTPDIVAGVWVGLDDFQYKLGNGMAGSVAALPFWADFMKTVYDSLDFERGSFAESNEVVKLKICNDSKKPATQFCPNTYEEIFNINYRPSDKCDIHVNSQYQKRSRRKRF